MLISPYPKPEIVPPDSHPRLMLRASDIPRIKASLNAQQNLHAYSLWQKLVNETVSFESHTSRCTYNSHTYAVVESKAFQYLINDDRECGEEAVSSLLQLLRECDFSGSFMQARYAGHIIFLAAQVYDWCYPLLTSSERNEIIDLCEKIGSQMEIGYPPSGQGNISGHGGEAQLLRDLLSLGIAVYNERQDIYDYCAGRIFMEIVPPRNYFCASHGHHQGSAYGSYRYAWEVFCERLFMAMSGKRIFAEDMAYVGYEFLYLLRPDGQTLRLGDDFNEQKNDPWDWRPYVIPMFLAASCYGDPYYKGEFLREQGETLLLDPHVGDDYYKRGSFGEGMYTPVIHLVWNDPENHGKPLEELPLDKYFPSPIGMIISRSGWSIAEKPERLTGDSLVLMKIGEHWGANHDHLDTGSFQIFRYAPLASESGYYDSYYTPHDYCYNKRTIAHNCITVLNPDEVMGFKEGTPRDGGQRRPAEGREAVSFADWTHMDEYRMARITAHEIGDKYCFIAGDLTPAYSNSCEQVHRSMLWYKLEDGKGIFAVLDDVTALDAAFRKASLLHMQSEPLIEQLENSICITIENGSGKLVCDCLLPTKATAAAIGGEGQEFVVEGRNYPFRPTEEMRSIEGGWGRVEISPAMPAKKDRFLMVMQVLDEGETARPTAHFEKDGSVGAVVGNLTIKFSEGGTRADISHI